MSQNAWIFLSLVLSFGCRPPDAPAMSQLAVELVPGNGFRIGTHEYDTSDVSWADKERFTQQIAPILLPEVLGALRINPDSVQVQPGLGGYEGVSSPSLEIRASVSPEAADSLAAALGLVAFQWSVLVTHVGAEIRPTTGWGAARFDSPPQPELAQAFFLHAAATHPALGLGYSRFGNDMIFLNLRDDQGNPTSGLEDAAYVDALRVASRSFEGAEVKLQRGRPLEAHLVGNRWSDEAPAGDDYLSLLPDSAEPILLRLQAHYQDAVEDHGNTHRWFAKDDAPQ